MTARFEALFRFVERAGEIIAVLLFGTIMYLVLAG